MSLRCLPRFSWARFTQAWNDLFLQHPIPAGLTGINWKAMRDATRPEAANSRGRACFRLISDTSNGLRHLLTAPAGRPAATARTSRFVTAPRPAPPLALPL